MVVTLKDVASAANVSTSTASLVLSGRYEGRVSPTTQQRVHEAARRLKYSGNAMARGLRMQRSGTVGFLSDRITTTPFAVRMVQAAQEVAWERGLLLFLLNTDGNADFERSALDAFKSRQVDGIIYACMSHRIIDLPEGLGPDSVFLNGRPRGRERPSVVPDERQGAYDATTELINAGHRRISFLFHGVETAPGVLRLQGYAEALKDHGLTYDEELVRVAPRSIQGSADAAHGLLKQLQPTAVFCYSDRIAAGVYRAAAHLGLRVPEDLSVVGFDDQEYLASALTPALTTVALPHDAMGRWAMNELLAGSQTPGEDGLFEPRLIACELVRRDSVTPPPGGNNNF